MPSIGGYHPYVLASIFPGLESSRACVGHAWLTSCFPSTTSYMSAGTLESIAVIAVDRYFSLFISFNTSLLQGRLPVNFEQASSGVLNLFFPPGHVRMIDISPEPQQENNGGRR
ncbi:hypothetical protein TNCV_2571531 [Trichonephila clavipes]|nr:hypothetical protein TNCV_2571531 [Trichonephila clavipes]